MTTAPSLVDRLLARDPRAVARAISIIEDGDAVPIAGSGEAPLDPAKAVERLADRVGRHAERMRASDGGGGVGLPVGARGDRSNSARARAGVRV